MYSKAEKRILCLLLSFLTVISLTAVSVPAAAAGVPSPLGFVFAGTAYDMYPGESGGSEGTARWAMDDNGYFTITLEKTGTSSFYFTNAVAGTQARFGGMLVAGGGGGGSGLKDAGGGGGSGGNAYIQTWAESYWNNDTSYKYGQFYASSTSSGRGWKISDFLNMTGNTIDIGEKGAGGRVWEVVDSWPDFDKSGYPGGETTFGGITVTGGKGGVDSPNSRFDPPNLHKAPDGTMRDENGNDVSGQYRQINFWGSTIDIGRGAYSGGESSFYPELQGYWALHGHEYTACDAIIGDYYNGKGNGSPGSGIRHDNGGGQTGSGSFKERIYSPWPGGPSYATANGVIILEGKADLVTVRVYKSTNDFPANRADPADTSTLGGFLYVVHCEEGYVPDFLLRTNDEGYAERGGLPLAHYTITEVCENDKMEGYEGYMEWTVYGSAYLNSLEVF